MADKKVDVTFLPPDRWEFSPERIVMKASGRITLERAVGNTTDWSFVDADIVDGDDEFTVAVASDGKQLHINDKYSTRGEWCYTVTVRNDANGTSYTSPDPQIINSGPE